VYSIKWKRKESCGERYEMKNLNGYITWRSIENKKRRNVKKKLSMRIKKKNL